MPRKPESVTQYMAKLEHPMKAEIEALRALVTGADPRISEQIKWNAPSFCFEGDDRVTLRLQPGNRLQMVFHRGAKVKEIGGFSFEDPTGRMKWQAADRAVVDIKGMACLDPALLSLVVRWMEATR